MNLRPLAFGIVVTAASSSFAQTAADQQAIRALFARVDAAKSRKDVTAIKKEMTADAYWTDPQGKKVSAATAMSQLSDQLKAVKSMTNKTTVKSITFKNGKAIVNTTNSSVVMIANPQTKKDMKIESRGSAVDTLVKVNGAWKVQSVQSKTQQLFVDGKPMNMQPQPAGGKGKGR